MYFVNYSTYEGRPPMIFRSPEVIRRDLFNIKEKIKATNEQLNVHSALMELVSRANSENTSDLISDLRYIVEDAEESLECLFSLKKQLEALSLELEETLCVIGRGQ